MTEQPRPMLASHDWDEAKIQKHLVTDGYVLVQPKIDGMRVLMDDGVARSRSWKEWTNVSIQAFVKENAELTHGWDGEMLPGIIENTPTAAAFRAAQSGLRAANGASQLTYYLFDNYDPSWAHLTYEHRFLGLMKDLVPSREWTSIEEVCEHSQSNTQGVFKGEGYDCLVKLCPTYMVYSLEGIYELEEKFLGDGFEGGILRRKGRGYKWNRSTVTEGSLVALKRFKTAEAVIIGCYPRERNDNEATINELGYTHRSAHKAGKVALECLGGFHCRLVKYPDIEFDIGVLKGLSMVDKERLWTVRESLVGSIVEFADQLYDGGYDKPRTPVFHRFRDPIDL